VNPRAVPVAAALLSAVLTVAASACGASAPRRQLAVFAAASLTDVMPALAEAYESSRPDVEIVATLEASSLLRVQIEEGAPANVFLSADERNARALHEAGLAEKPEDFAFNEVVLVVPATNPAGIHSWTDLARPGLTIIAAGEEVPVTAYAEQTIRALNLRNEAPPGFAIHVDRAIASREDNVRAVLAKIALGEGDAGFVYATDAASTADVRVIPLPDGVAAEARYAAAVIRDSSHHADAVDFVTWLRSDEAVRILSEHGLGVLVPQGQR
jgi:molybdate transport system substrate-binding protein